MSNSSIDLKFADGEYTFALPLPQIREVERKTGIGIGGLFGRLTKGCFLHPLSVAGDPKYMFDAKLSEFYALDIIETIRHGLIGGAKGVVNGEEIKVSPLLANKLIDAYVLDAPFQPNWEVAVAIAGARMMRFDPPKKDRPPSEGAKPKKKKAGSITA